VNSHLDPDFRKAFAQLPASVRAQARAAYRLFQTNPYHTELAVQSHRPVHLLCADRGALSCARDKDARR
jgi:hypothetical protein